MHSKRQMTSHSDKDMQGLPSAGQTSTAKGSGSLTQIDGERDYHIKSKIDLNEGIKSMFSLHDAWTVTAVKDGVQSFMENHLISYT